MATDKIIETFDTVYVVSGNYYATAVRPSFHNLMKLYSDNNSCAALDIGSGEGSYALYLADRGYRVTALDVSEVGLKKMVHPISSYLASFRK